MAKKQAIPPKYTDRKESKPFVLSTKLSIAIIIAVCFILFGKGLKFEYTSCDDTDLIVDNYPFIKKFKNISLAFKQSCFEIPGHLTDDKAYYRPTLISSFILDAQFQPPTYDGFPKPKAFHFTNIMLHAMVVIGLFLLLQLLGINIVLALLLSLLYAVHPLNVMAVSWIPGRNDSLLGIFTVLSLYSLIKLQNAEKPVWLIIHILSFALCLFTKESGVVLIPLFYLFLWAFGFNWVGHFKNPKIIAGYVISTALWMYARAKALEGDASSATLQESIQTFITNIPVFPMHISKYLFPLSLSVMPGVTQTNLILGILAIVILGYIAYSQSQWKVTFFILLWIGLFLAPTLLVPKLPAYEHRNYIPLLGLIIGLSTIKWFKDFSLKSNKGYIILGVIVLFFFRSYAHTETFRNRWNFWENATVDSPFAPSAHVNLGKLKEQINELDVAMKHYEQALAIDSATLKANNNYGAMFYIKEKKNDVAAYYFKRELKYHPNSVDALNNLGIYYRNKGDLDSSLLYWKKLVWLNKYYLTAYPEITKIYAYKKNYDSLMKYQALEQKYNKVYEDKIEGIR